ncbi:hypothetical protein LCGC14_0325870 [marine sediment metagenome]|uniref:Uncharacterized protein n=1 Tax=marine sediment metagenome TaxID=412755 RepID=A0A0F9W553_9ZZZZ
METGTILQLLGMAFMFGAGWNSLRMQIKRVQDAVTVISENHLVHIEAKLNSLPCAENDERIARLEQGD